MRADTGSFNYSPELKALGEKKVHQKWMFLADKRVDGKVFKEQGSVDATTMLGVKKMDNEKVNLVVYVRSLPEEDHVLLFFTNEKIIAIKTSNSLASTIGGDTVMGSVAAPLTAMLWSATGPIGVGLASLGSQARGAKRANKQACNLSKLSANEILAGANEAFVFYYKYQGLAHERKGVRHKDGLEMIEFGTEDSGSGKTFCIDYIGNKYRWLIVNIPSESGKKVDVDEIINLMKEKIPKDIEFIAP